MPAKMASAREAFLVKEIHHDEDWVDVELRPCKSKVFQSREGAMAYVDALQKKWNEVDYDFGNEREWVYDARKKWHDTKLLGRMHQIFDI